MFEYDGTRRPPFAQTPQPGQESVWDYPRPPRVERVDALLEVKLGDVVVAQTGAGRRVVETAGAPVYFFPPSDVAARLEPESRRSHCEWKGEAHYFQVIVGSRHLRSVAFSYPSPHPTFAAIAGHFAFYVGALQGRVGAELVRPQPGGFYAGWITEDLAGPIKGGPGSAGW